MTFISTPEESSDNSLPAPSLSKTNGRRRIGTAGAAYDSMIPWGSLLTGLIPQPSPGQGMEFWGGITHPRLYGCCQLPPGRGEELMTSSGRECSAGVSTAVGVGPGASSPLMVLTGAGERFGADPILLCSSSGAASKVTIRAPPCPQRWDTV